MTASVNQNWGQKMGHFTRKFALTAAAAVCFASTPAHAARCWSTSNANALAIKHLDTMLMVQTLRCQLINADVAAHYNQFVEQNRPALIAANQRVQDHFAVANGRADALNQYDQLAVSIANSFGSGENAMDCLDLVQVMESLSDQAEPSRMLDVAMALVGHPAQTTPRCDSRVARVQ